jgi:WD40 repeat protein
MDWSPDGTMFVTGHEDGTIRIWDANSGMPISILTGHEGIIHDARISPDNTRIVSASEDGSVRLWDVKTANELMTMWGHVGSVNSVWWSPDGSRMVSGGFDALPRVWDVATGQTLYVLAGHTSPVVSVFWSDDGSRISTHSLDATAKIWDANTGRLFLEIDNVPPSDFTNLGYAELDPTGRWLVTGGGLITGVELWDTASPVPVLFGHSLGQEWGNWSPDGRLIATAGTDGSTRIWDAMTGEQVRDLEQGYKHDSWSPDSARLVTPIGVEGFALAVWDIESGEVLARLVPDDDGLGTWSMFYVVWSPDGNYILATAGRSDTLGQILIWDANTYEQLVTIASDDGCAGRPTWSPDSTQIVAGCSGVAPGEKTYAGVWDALSGNLAMKLENPGEGSTWYTEWSPDGTKILTTHGGAIVVIWDVATGERLLTFTEHQSVGAVASWSPDGASIVSEGFGETQLKIWDANTGEVSMSISLPSSAYEFRWSPDGSQIIISGDGLIEPLIMRVWRSTDDLVAHAYECCVSRELSPEERTQFGLPERNE